MPHEKRARGAVRRFFDLFFPAPTDTFKKRIIGFVLPLIPLSKPPLETR